MASEADKQDGPEVTPAMIEAGVYALRDMPLMADWREAVSAVYLAMEIERQTSVAASATSAER